MLRLTHQTPGPVGVTHRAGAFELPAITGIFSQSSMGLGLIGHSSDGGGSAGAGSDCLDVTDLCGGGLSQFRMSILTVSF